jgi:nicotinamidase-related amidase
LAAPKRFGDSLISLPDSVLIVVDVQDHFLDKLPSSGRQLLLNRIGWLIAVAARLRVPLLATAEDMDKLGGLNQAVAAVLPAEALLFNKMIFGLAAEPEIMAALEATGRQTVILVGLETDVCVTQSALGLLRAGYQVVALADGTGSPGQAHRAGLDRMRAAGVVVSTVKGLYYEWVRTVAEHEAFLTQYGSEIGQPPGIEL